ncbi:hypothetical protein [Rhizobium sp. BK491]|uniref:hypothetical protein n=1 Tax=Rhizobium sp. BK491 TaxID=2587009 RepID=UPI001618C9E3|nr:hypothetical protein [Rhizobium sp. BK491]MBB3570502.1 hypothetical protein [Rhizobium sp. BK491]
MADLPENAGDKQGQRRGDPLSNAMIAAAATLRETGQRGTSIYSSSDGFAGMAPIVFFLYGIPFFIIVAMIPAWEKWGDFSPVVWLNVHIAPAVNSLSDNYRSTAFPRLPLRRVLIAATSMIELLFVSSFLTKLSYRGRKQALMVWLCFDKSRLFGLLLGSSAAFVAVWCVLFYNWTLLDFVESEPKGSKIIILAVVLLPFSALICGRIAAIVTLGIFWSATKEVKKRLGKMSF